MRLTPDQLQRYDQDGFLVFDGLFRRDEARELLQRLGEVVAQGERRAAGIRLQVEPSVDRGEAEASSYLESLRKVEGLVEHEPLFGALARDPRLIGIFSSLLGPDIKLFRDALMMKPAHHGSAKPYHQDSAYWPIDPPALASCWLALDEATRENGCMRVLPGSHRRGLVEHYHFEDFQVDEATLNTGEEVEVPLAAGGCLIFHSMLLHATSPNRSPHPRRSMIVSVMSARSRWTGLPEKRPSFPLLSGMEYPGCV